MEMIKGALRKIAIAVDKHFWIIVSAIYFASGNIPGFVLCVLMAFYTKISEIADAVDWNNDTWKRSLATI